MAKGDGEKVKREFELVLRDLPNMKGLKGFTYEEIDILLAKLPTTIKHQDIEFVKSIEALEEAKNNLKRVIAKKHLEAVARKEQLGLSSDSDRKAWVANTKEVIDAESDLLTAKIDSEFARVMFEFAQNLFVSVRKKATILENEMSADNAHNRYGRPMQRDENDWDNPPEKVHSVKS